MRAPIQLTDDELRESLTIAKNQASISRFHRERLEELQFEFNRRGLK